MAHQQHFSESLMRRFNDMMQENTQLQLQLARQHDEIANLTNQLHRGGGGQFSGSVAPNVQALQHQVHDLQSQLLLAKERAQAAETRLKDSVTRFNSAYAEQRDCIKGLERQLKELKPAGSYRSGKGKAKAVDSELASTKADLKRTKTNFARLQKQFEAEKMGNTAAGGFPAAASEKERRLEEEDQDDEEPSNPFMKEEPLPEDAVLQEPTFQETGFRESTFQEPELIEDVIAVKAEPGTEATMEPQPEETPLPVTIKEEFSSVPGSSAVMTTAEDIDMQRRDSSVIEVASTIMPSVVAPTANMTVPEKSPAPDAIRTSEPKEPTPMPTPRSTRTATRKIKTEPSATPPPRTRKRRRLTRQEVQQELADQDIIDLDQEPPRPHKRSRTRKQNPYAELQETFEFKAVTEHHRDGEISALDSKEDLRGEIPELWELINTVHSGWGEGWAEKFEENKPCAEACVSEKMAGGKSVWKEGEEAKFACKKCTEERKPCFAWTGEEFWLLPLHEEDRKEEVEEGCELRYWVNDQ